MDNKQLVWCAIGDSFTYLNDHLDETGYRVSKGYLNCILDKMKNTHLLNIGINGSTTADWVSCEIPQADLYTVLLGTNDWHMGYKIGTEKDFQEKKKGTILGNFGTLLDHIYQKNKNAIVIAGNPVERADFVYLLDPHNNAVGSYEKEAGQSLSDVALAIKTACESVDILTVDLNRESGFSQETVIRFKHVKKDGVYRDLPYPQYTGLAFNPDADEYPYPPDAAGLTYDGLHPTDEGNKIIADLFLKKMEEHEKLKAFLDC